jgi:glycerate-2-kinase
VEPAAAVARLLDRQAIDTGTGGRLACVAAGKAAVPMMRSWLDRHAASTFRAVVIAPSGGHPWPESVRTFDAGHPTPTVESERGALAALDLARSLDGRDTLVVLLSGGASALMAAPAPPVTLADKVVVTRLLLGAGASIDRLNCVRRHLSCIKGGQLAAACQARIDTFAISDVCVPVEDDPAVIGSGPTSPDPSTFEQALGVIEEARIASAMPGAALARLRAGAAGHVAETPKRGDAVFERTSYVVIAGRRDAMRAAEAAATALGYHTVVMDPPVLGEARLAGPSFVEAALASAPGGPVCVIASGETTVTVRGTGRGGRNQELALAAAERLARLGRPALLVSLGTDGVDGPTDAAGAIVDSGTVARAAARGLGPPHEWLDRNDAYHYFEPLGDLVRTGPTGTNVGDVQMLLLA